MADYKIFKQNKKGDEVDVIFYIPVSDVSIHPKIAEDIGTGDGSIYEHQTTVKFSAELTTAQKKSVIERKYSNLVITINSLLEKIYQFYGYEGEIS